MIADADGVRRPLGRRSGLLWLLVLLSVTRSATGRIDTVKIAHLQPNDPSVAYEPHVLRMCAADLKERAILPNEINVELLTMQSCNRYSGVENAAYLHYLKNASVYFGPGCNHEMLVIGRLASRWNVPIIAHLSGDDALSDRTVFNTLGSVALTSSTEMARATLTYIQLYGWTQVGLVRPTINFDRLSLHSLKNYLKEQQIEINIEIEFDPFLTPDEMIATGKLKYLRNKARIIIVEMGMDFHATRNFMVAIQRAQMKTNDYVYIIPWLAHIHDHYPWEASNIDKVETRRAFEETIVITAHGYDKKFIENFETRFSQITGVVSSYYATLSYMSLYDALFLYGLAIRDAFEETRNQTVFLDGSLVWRKMTGRQFIGATGQVLMNSKGVRVPSYATYFVKNGTMRIVVELTARLGDKVKCAMSENDCSEHVAHETISHYWSSNDGNPPVDMPKCGFDGGLCDMTSIFVTIGAIVFLAITVPLGYLLYVREKERMLYEMTWRIPREQVRLLESGVKGKSDSSFGTMITAGRSASRSIGSGSLAGSMLSRANGRLSVRQAIANGVRCSYKRYQQTRSINFLKKDLSRLKELKLIENENLNKFYGICFNQQNELIVLWLLCQRGSLEDVLFNDELKISRNFQVSFAKDVIKGLHFLHMSSLKCHGFLCLQHCLVDSNWNVKLTNFLTEEIVAEKFVLNELKFVHEKSPKKVVKKRNQIGGKSKSRDREADRDRDRDHDRDRDRDRDRGDTEADNDDGSSISDEENARRMLTQKSRLKKYVQQAPEIIREYISSKHLPAGSQAADMYGLGMVLYQILFKIEPFSERGIAYNKIIDMIAMANDDDQIIRPSFPKQQLAGGDEAYNLQLLSAIEACWLEIPEMRPNIKRIKTLLNANLKSNSTGTLMDQMMKMMEDYTTNLEQLVKDRTAMLEDAQQQADRLLKNMLPPSVAEDLKVGKPIIPQLYQHATVLFSDIRGFSRISAASTPTQIVNFLNDLFSGYDAIIAKHDAYKVETIGDAYMIVSGVPRENGNNHVMHIAEIALKMRTLVSNFKLAHRPDEILMIRVGFHSGAVAAGVVGLAAPRYCLFGDTVNMASRMESTSLPNKIQISESSYNFLKCFFPSFITTERGKIEVKGKGECLTYFLDAKEVYVEGMRRQPSQWAGGSSAVLQWTVWLVAGAALARAMIDTIKIAHLQPNEPSIMHEPHVLRMCAADLKERAILPSEINLQIYTMESCNRFSGVEHAAYLHYLRNASVYFGPGCNNEMLIIGRLASRWNVPIIAHLSGDDALSDRSVFDTLGSVALTSATEMARATLTYIHLYGWKQVGLVRASVNFDRLSLHSLKNYLKDHHVEINVEIELDPFMTPDEIVATGRLKTLRNKARIIIVEMGMDLHATRNFMVAIQRAQMKTNDYVYIIPWLAHMHDHYPWEASNIDKHEVRNAFDEAIVITAHGYDKKFIEDFEIRFSQVTGIISSHYATLSYMSLYDALFLYGLAIRDAFEETRNQTVFLDGSLVWRKMTGRQFIGATGQVLMNSKGVRVPSYATYFVKNGTMRIVVELTARLGDKVKCAMSENDCSEHVAHETMSHYWNSYDGVLPPDMPKCGFDGSLCDYTAIFVGIGVLAFLGVAVPLGYFIYVKEKERMLYDMTWRIPREQVRILEPGDGKSSSSMMRNSLSKSIARSLGSSSFAGSNSSRANARLSARQAIANGVRCSYKAYQQTRNISFLKTDLARLKELKLIENENLNKFYGICFNQQNELIVLWLLCQRGSLEDILFNDELKISRNFQVSFAKDVVKGLYFVHTSPLKYHGFLCLQNCLVDSNWNVKLTNFVTDEIIGDKLRHNEVRVIVQKDPSKKALKKKKKRKTAAASGEENGANGNRRERGDSAPSDSEQSTNDEDAERRVVTERNTNKKFIQQAPEIIREYISSKHLPAGSQSADMYGLGMVLYQILFKLEPFYERSATHSKILDMIAMANDDDQIIRPSFPNQTTVPADEAYNLQLLSAIEACWLEIPEMRPNIKRIKTLLNANLKSTSSGSLVDQMMKMMEDYTTNLEQLVKDRTAMLEDAQQQADRLLKNMLPPSVAEDLKVGKPIIPQLYQNATVLFSDIRGFTRISSTSTPMQIVTFLNDLFSGFDAIIGKHDAYKVETIGDAYMIVSGVPRENGNNHVMHIAEIALKMRTFVSNFKLTHKPEEIMMVRIGFHSGSVAAGVVGLAAPRYCLFGDTVNMASRMESTGLANKIQITESSLNLLKCFFHYFIVVERGKVDIKGKGECTTYFLEGKEMTQKKK